MYIRGFKPQEDEVLDEQRIREWAKQECRAVLSQEYGPALEVELVQRIAEGVAAGTAPNIDNLAAAVEARIVAKLTA
jgi:hypothetical protein